MYKGQDAKIYPFTLQQAFIEHTLTHDVVDTAENKADGPCFYEIYLVVEQRSK